MNDAKHLVTETTWPCGIKVKSAIFETYVEETTCWPAPSYRITSNRRPLTDNERFLRSQFLAVAVAT